MREHWTNRVYASDEHRFAVMRSFAAGLCLCAPGSRCHHANSTSAFQSRFTLSCLLETGQMAHALEACSNPRRMSSRWTWPSLVFRSTTLWPNGSRFVAAMRRGELWEKGPRPAAWRPMAMPIAPSQSLPQSNSAWSRKRRQPYRPLCSAKPRKHVISS